MQRQLQTESAYLPLLPLLMTLPLPAIVLVDGVVLHHQPFHLFDARVPIIEA
jgi:hypothetical protein